MKKIEEIITFFDIVRKKNFLIKSEINVIQHVKKEGRHITLVMLKLHRNNAILFHQLFKTIVGMVRSSFFKKIIHEKNDKVEFDNIPQ